MYYIKKRMEISASHKLKLSYDSPCQQVHGHNWIVTVYCKSSELDEDGMIVDFTVIKKAVHAKLDHKMLNDVLDFNPTAERMAKWICSQVPHCYKVDVQETEGNVATYELDFDIEEVLRLASQKIGSSR